MRDEAMADQLESRLIDFGVRILKVASALPKSIAAKHLAGQLLRCGTAAAPNYAEARGSESRADFVHKLKIALKELNECHVWLRMICKTEMLHSKLLDPLIEENRQLCRILNASVTTAKTSNLRSITMTNDQ
jgi:four helix bundle protein